MCDLFVSFFFCIVPSSAILVLFEIILLLFLFVFLFLNLDLNHIIWTVLFPSLLQVQLSDEFFCQMRIGISIINIHPSSLEGNS